VEGDGFDDEVLKVLDIDGGKVFVASPGCSLLSRPGSATKLVVSLYLRFLSCIQRADSRCVFFCYAGELI